MPFFKGQHGRCFLLLTAAVVAAGLTGCAVPPSNTPPSSGSGGGGSAPNVDLTGNWKMVVPNATTPMLTGSIFQQSATSGPAYTTAVFRVTAPCYASTPVVPLQGSLGGTTLQITSFAVDAQTLTLYGTADTTGSTLTGTFNTAGGCQGTTSGNFTGQRYTTIAGNYSGTVSSGIGQSISANLTQDTNPTGDGTFILSGSATLTGFTCFQSATIATGDAYVSGDSVTLTLTANDGTSRIALNGTLDTAAKTITVGAAQVIGGSCSGSLGPLVLTLG